MGFAIGYKLPNWPGVFQIDAPFLPSPHWGPTFTQFIIPSPLGEGLTSYKEWKNLNGWGNEENNCDNLKYTQLAYRTKAPSYQPQASVLEKEKAPVFTEAFSSL